MPHHCKQVAQLSLTKSATRCTTANGKILKQSRVKWRKICPTSNRWNHALFSGPKKQQNFACLSNCRDCADRSHNLPGPAPKNVVLLRELHISFTSVPFRRRL